MCLNKPIQIPVGRNGASVFIAYAQTDTGTGFSYTPSDSRDYISFVTKIGTVAQADFTIWMKYQGNDGTNGTNGVSLTSVVVSDGVTAISGTTYPINTVVAILSSGTVINAGVVSVGPLTWTTITPINSWTSGTGVNVAKYAKDANFIYFRGRADFSAAASDVFCTIASLGITGTVSSSCATNSAGANGELDEIAALVIDSSGNLTFSSASTTLKGSIAFLDTIAPIPIR